MVAHLAASGRYRILHKLEPRRVAVSVGPECPLKGVIVDTETTGLNHRRDEIIEIGVIAFTFDEQGLSVMSLECMADCSSLNPPSQKRSPRSPALLTRWLPVSLSIYRCCGP